MKSAFLRLDHWTNSLSMAVACLMLVIASALSIQDVRERPKEAPERAAELHRRFDVCLLYTSDAADE